MNFHVRKKIEINHYYKTTVFHNDCIKCTTLTLQKQSLDCILVKKLAEFLSCRGKSPANNPLTYLFFLYALHASSADLKYPTCRLSSRTMISKSFISSSGAFFETVTVVNSGVVLDPFGRIFL
mgnify:FL=1